MEVCKRCHGNGWVLYAVPARQISDMYKDVDYKLEIAKRCPECTRAQADSWEQDFKAADEEWRGAK